MIFLLFWFLSGCSLNSTVNEDQNIDTAKNDDEILTCSGGLINVLFFELGEVYSSLRTHNKLDSFLWYYNLKIDTINEIRHSTNDTFWIVLRKYYSSGNDSSYFIFRAFLHKSQDNIFSVDSNQYVIFTLYDAKIQDRSLRFSNGVYIGMSRDLFTNQLKLSMDTSQNIYTDLVVCDTFQVSCDGLCGNCKYIFNKDTLSEIIFLDVDYEY